MFNQLEPNVNATVSFLKHLKVKVNTSTVNETLQNHPDWPSLLSISDSLNKWNIKNGAGKIDTIDIDRLPTPFIAYTNVSVSEAPLVIVTQVSDDSVTAYQKNYNRPKTETREDFLKKWNGIYLIAESDNLSGEPNYKANKRKFLFSFLIPVSAFLALFIVSLVFLKRTVDATNAAFLSATAIYLQYFILLSGIIITSLLLWYEIDKNNPLLNKVCTGIAKGNCNAILTGNKSKVFRWLSWSEVGFFYFTGGLLVLLFSERDINSAFSLVGILNLLALPYTLFSVYYQWRVVKQWCVLCLSVQVLLLLGGINVIADLSAVFYDLSASFIIRTLLIYLLPVLIWYSVKPFILRLQQAKNTKREYLRIKFNTQIFETLLKKQKEITIPADGLGIDIGNPDATNTLIKVCNPYCGPCSKAHPKIEKLLEETPNLKVKIIFTTPNQPDHPTFKPVNHLLAIDEQSSREDMKQALDDWYLANKKDYDLFADRYPMNGELTKQGDKIEAMDKWCKEMNIRVTPTFLINGYQLPNAYGVEDLQYFLLE